VGVGREFKERGLLLLVLLRPAARKLVRGARDAEVEETGRLRCSALSWWWWWCKTISGWWLRPQSCGGGGS